MKKVDQDFLRNYKIKLKQMTLQELKILFKNMILKSDLGTIIRFIPENTLRINEIMANSANYEIYEENSKFYLKHNNILGNDDLLIEIISEEPLSMSFTERCTGKNKYAILRQQTNLL